jgi:hypothetical protein
VSEERKPTEQVEQQLPPLSRDASDAELYARGYLAYRWRRVRVRLETSYGDENLRNRIIRGKDV